MSRRRTQTKYVVWHCSATKPSADVGAKEIDQWHRARGFDGIGYALVIRRDGTLEAGRPLDEVGAHVAGYNEVSVGVVMVGGLDEFGKSHASRPDLFTQAQWATAKVVYEFMRRLYAGAQHVGHRDLSPDKDKDGRVEQHEWLKDCPCFSVATEIVRL